MRRFFVMMSLVALSACGGPPSSEAAPAEPAQESGDVGATALCSSANAWECFCAQYKTSTTCNQASQGSWHCVWVNNRCEPTYE